MEGEKIQVFLIQWSYVLGKVAGSGVPKPDFIGAHTENISTFLSLSQVFLIEPIFKSVFIYLFFTSSAMIAMLCLAEKNLCKKNP